MELEQLRARVEELQTELENYARQDPSPNVVPLVDDHVLLKARLFDALGHMRGAYSRTYTLLPQLIPWTGAHPSFFFFSLLN